MRNSAAILFGQLAAFACLPFLAQAASVDVDLQSSTDGTSWSSAAAGLVASDGSPVYYRATMTPAGGSETVTNVILVDRPAGSPAHVRLESGDDLSAWSHVLPGNYDITGTKQFVRVKEDDTSPEFISVQGGTVTIDSIDTTVSDFLIGRFEVTQEIWDDVYNWALSNGYSFSNNAGGNWTAGGCVQAAHPVSELNWSDALKWCNARSEKEGDKTPVYYSDDTFSTVLKTGEPLPSVVYSKTDADGYRLASREEWLFAAAGGNLRQGFTYSGSNDVEDVARYELNSVGSVCPIVPDFVFQGSWPVGSLLPNELGIYDMSGNVREWTVDGLNDSSRFAPGGTFNTDANSQVVSNNLNQSGIGSTSAQTGLRLARNAPVPEAAATVESDASSLSGKGKRNDFSRAQKKPGQLK